MHYPESKRDDIAETHFGVAVADPYRWLEADPRSNSAVARWIEAQNALSKPYLAALPGRDAFFDRLRTLFARERLTAPRKTGGRYFFTRNPGLDDQPMLMVRETVDGADRMLIDPNAWSRAGTAALAEWEPSRDGRYVAYAVQQNGTDWRTIRVLDVETGTVLPDRLDWARFTQIAWKKDGSGFFYARSAEPEADAGFGAPTLDHAVYFHQLGTTQSEDPQVYAPSSDLPLLHVINVTADGRYAVFLSTPISGGNSVAIMDLASPDRPVRTIVEGYDHAWSVIGNVGTRLFLTSQKDAERGKVVTINLADEAPAFVDLIAQADEAVLFEAAMLGNRIVISYMVDAKTEIKRFLLDGTPDGGVELPGIGTAGGFQGRPDDDEAFVLFTSFDIPMSIYRYEVGSNTLSEWAKPEIEGNLDDIVVEQRFYSSKDGTRVPIFIMRRRDVTDAAPTMLTAYGGFGIPSIPFFQPEPLAWVEMGGVYAVANIRGGGEYGRAWHEAGRLGNKQNVFDDFIAAAEFLKAENIAASDGLAIQGGSNGGLLVGAVVNQRPDLFAAALPDVGVMDMLRFHRFTAGAYWAQEFGTPESEADFPNLLSYSPLHNIEDGADYPAILATTADADDRVVPAHSFKYVATLQAADIGSRPHLLRVETEAGHGAGKPTTKIIDQAADTWAFAAYWTGLMPGDAD